MKQFRITNVVHVFSMLVAFAVATHVVTANAWDFLVPDATSSSLPFADTAHVAPSGPGSGEGASASGESAALPVAGTVTRSSDPFAVPGWAYRVENLPAKWEKNGDSIAVYVEYAGSRWTCEDGSVSVPSDELPKVISKLDLLLVLRELEKVDLFFVWLDASGLKPYWDAAQVMSTDHPLFAQGVASVSEALGLSEEEVQAILSRIEK